METGLDLLHHPAKTFLLGSRIPLAWDNTVAPGHRGGGGGVFRALSQLGVLAARGVEGRRQLTTMCPVTALALPCCCPKVIQRLVMDLRDSDRQAKAVHTVHFVPWVR